MQERTRYLVFALAAATAAASGCAGARSTAAPAAAPAAPVAEKSAPVTPTPTPAAEMPKPPTLRLGDEVKPISYQAHLTVAPTADSFGGEIQIAIELTDAADHMWLNGRNITVKGATLGWNGASLPVKTISHNDFIGFLFPKAIGPGRATLTIHYRGKVSKTDESGLFRQKQDGKWYLYSQFEAIDARRAFPCFDEPSFKVPWQLTLTVGKDLVAVSNTPVVSTTPGPKAGEKTVKFAQTKPLPSYLIALAVGPFDVVPGGTVGRNKAPFRVIVPHGRASATSYAVKNTPTYVKLLENYLDIPYPFRKLDLIAVPHFFGAMENPGAITFAESLLTRKKSALTSEYEQRYSYVAAHELTHQWFGDLVTLAWWNDTWLNESFADWLSTKLVYRWKPQWNGPVHAVQAAERAEATDSLASARKIRQPIKSEDDIGNIFDAISYAKGRSVLDMFEAWIGPNRFQKGVRAYLHAHEWKTATAADFLASLAAASKPQVADAFRTFLDQPGVPLISAKLTCAKGKTPALALSQQRFLPEGSTGATGETWSVPVCVAYPRGRKRVHECQLVTTKTATLKLTQAKRCPRWVLANDHSLGYYRVAYARPLLRKLVRARKLTTAEKLGLLNDVSALTDTGGMSTADALALLPSLLRSRDPSVTGGARAVVAEIDRYLVPAKLQRNYARFVRKLFGRTARRLGWKPRKSDSNAVRALRRGLVPFVAQSGHDMRLVRQARRLTTRWLKDRSGIAPDLAGSVLATAARYGDAKLYDTYLKAAKQEKNQRYRQILLAGMASFRDPALLKKNFHLFLSDAFEVHDAFALLRVPRDWKQGDQLAWELFKKNYAQVMKKVPAFVQRYVILGAAAGFCDGAHRQDAAAFFKTRAKQIPGGPRALAEALERVQLCIAFRKAQAPAVAAFLKKQ